METSSFDRLYLRQPAFEADSVRAMLKKAHQEAIALKETETLLAERFDLSIGLGLYTPAQLLEHAGYHQRSVSLEAPRRPRISDSYADLPSHRSRTSKSLPGLHSTAERVPEKSRWDESKRHEDCRFS